MNGRIVFHANLIKEGTAGERASPMKSFARSAARSSALTRARQAGMLSPGGGALGKVGGPR